MTPALVPENDANEPSPRERGPAAVSLLDRVRLPTGSHPCISDAESGGDHREALQDGGGCIQIHTTAAGTTSRKDGPMAVGQGDRGLCDGRGEVDLQQQLRCPASTGSPLTDNAIFNDALRVFLVGGYCTSFGPALHELC